MTTHRFLLSNPAALREVIATQGESLAQGMENFAADIERGHGQLAISQTVRLACPLSPHTSTLNWYNSMSATKNNT